MASDLEQLKTPLPASPEAEQYTLGCSILDGTPTNPVFEQAAHALDPEMFFIPSHRMVFAAMSRLFLAGRVLDPMAICEELKRTGDLERVGGMAFIASLIDGVARFSNIENYVRIVREKFQLRQLVAKGSVIMNRALDAEMEVDEQLRMAERELLEITARDTCSRWSHIGAVASDYIAKVEERGRSERPVVGFSTGFSDLDYLTLGLERKTVNIVAARPGVGKAQPLTAKIKTPTGWKLMGEIRVGDEVASIDGEPSVVTGVFPQGVRRIARVTFSDGRSAECCEDHLWEVHSCKWKWPKVVSTKAIAELLAKVRYQKRLSIPLFDGHFGGQMKLPMEPYLLGVLLGDGGFSSGTALRLSNPDAEVLEQVNDLIAPEFALKHSGAGVDYNLARVLSHHVLGHRGVLPNLFIEAVKAMGLWGKRSDEKFIPTEYFSASKDQRINLLRGLLDTDGTVTKTGAIQFDTTSPMLAKGVTYLVRSIGGSAHFKRKSASYVKDGVRVQCKDSYHVSIRYRYPRRLFSVTKKAERLPGDNYQKSAHISISSIEWIGEKEAQCISVSHWRKLYITDDFIVTHNTAFALGLTNNITNSRWNRDDDGLPPVVGWFSMEMDKEQLSRRLIAARAGVDMRALHLGRLTKEQWRQVVEAETWLAQWRTHIDDRCGLSIAKMREALRQLRQDEKKLDVVFIDYLQLGEGDSGGKKFNRAEEVGQFSRGMTQMAKDYDVCVVALSQCNRQAESRGGSEKGRISLGDLRESGQIEQDAYQVWGLYRDEVVNPETTKPNILEIDILKQRNGPPARVEVLFRAAQMKFGDLAREGQF